MRRLVMCDFACVRSFSGPALVLGAVLLASVGWVRAADPPPENGAAEIGAALESDQAARREGAVVLLGELAAQPPGLADRGYYAGVIPADFAKVIIGLAQKDPSARVREAALRSLAQIRPAVVDAKPALKDVLENENGKHGVAERVAAAEALSAFVPLSRDLFKVAEASGQVISLAGTALKDPSPAVRSAGARALKKFAENARLAGRETRESMAPVLRELKEQSPFLVQAVNDPATGPEGDMVRFEAREAVEELATLRQLLPRDVDVPSKGGGVEEQEAPGRLPAPVLDEKGDALFADVPAMVKALAKAAAESGEPEPRAYAVGSSSRIAALEAIERFGGDAAPAGPTLVKLLRDPNPFVRWIGARCLGKIKEANSAAKMDNAVDELIHLLGDSELDVQVAAAVALAPFGAEGERAVGALGKAAANGYARLRLAALDTLKALRPQVKVRPRTPTLVKALTYTEDPRVRKSAAELIGRYGTDAADAADALRAATRDEDGTVRLAAAEALLSVTRAAPK